jgi:hypothetical protein
VRVCLCVRASWRVFVACATHPSVARATRALLCSWVLCWRALSGDTRGAQARSRKKRVPHFQKKKLNLGTGHRTLVPGYAPICAIVYMCVGLRHTIAVGVPSCTLRVRCINVIDTMFSPNPAPSTAGSGYTRARTPQGGMSPTALSAMFPAATTTEGLTATELASQTYLVLARFRRSHPQLACSSQARRAVAARPKET